MTSYHFPPISQYSWLPSQIRIGDAERDRTCATLTEHFAAGRLTKEETDQRIQAALAAQYSAELAALVADLPTVPRTYLLPRNQAAKSIPQFMMEVFLGLLAIAAVGCFVLLLLGLAISLHVLPLVTAALSAIASAVATGTLVYHWTKQRYQSAAPATVTNSDNSFR